MDSSCPPTLHTHFLNSSGLLISNTRRGGASKVRGKPFAGLRHRSATICVSFLFFVFDLTRQRRSVNPTAAMVLSAASSSSTSAQRTSPIFRVVTVSSTPVLFMPVNVSVEFVGKRRYGGVDRLFQHAASYGDANEASRRREYRTM